MNNRDNQKLTFLGASPIIFMTTILYSIPIIIINHFLNPIFEINFIPYKILIAAAIILLCVGIPLYMTTLKVLKAAYKKQELVTNGIFSICRNPLFAVVIFLFLPGIILFFNSWLLLTIPCFMYFMFKIFINREEYQMEKEFGQKYVKYKNNTSAIFPKLWKYKK
jgi:protein-S-isoprenylcysteine O-methyltransferase Ste14